MRKIERLMNIAIKNNTDWRSANTRVENNDGVSTVYLHNNKIAEVGDDFVRVFDGGWQSVTTKSRLNAIINEFCNAFTDCLLYTSPSPRDKRQSRMPSSA